MTPPRLRPPGKVEATALRDLWAERGYRVPHTLTPSQEAVLESNTQYRKSRRDDGGCVVCEGQGEHYWLGERLECPDDSFGHPAQRLAEWYWVHNIPLQYQLLDWRDWPTDTGVKLQAKAIAEAYLDSYKGLSFYGQGLNIYSKTQGTGKTWVATAIQKDLTKSGVDTWFVRFLDVVSLYDWEDKAKKALYTDRIKGASFLVLDEVQPGWTPKQASLYREKLEELIRPRESDNLVTVLTTNMTRDELEDEFGRVFSLLSGKNEWISLEGAEDARISSDLWRKQAEAGENNERPPIT